MPTIPWKPTPPNYTTRPRTAESLTQGGTTLYDPDHIMTRTVFMAPSIFSQVGNVRRAGIASLLLFAACGAALARPASLEGKWKLNLAQSELLPDEEPPAELVMAITKDDNAVFRWTATVKMKNGETGSTSFDGAIDGKPHPVKGRPGSTSTFTWLPDGTLKQVSQGPGGIATEICSFSPDAKKMTCNTRQTDIQGRAAAYVEVFDRG